MPPPPATAEPPAADALMQALRDALLALARSGHSHEANRLAARAYVALRQAHPARAQEINVLMHGLVRIPNTHKEQKMANPDLVLDVRNEAPATRHTLIFDHYEHLSAGEGFVLVNDHDPKPLRYQFDAEHPDQFTWTYLEEGPETWRVRIGRPA